MDRAVSGGASSRATPAAAVTAMGALFEVTLPIWLFVKGFSAQAYGTAAD